MKGGKHKMKNKLISTLICIFLVAIVFTPCINAENKNTETLPIQYDEFEDKIEEIENKFYSAVSEEERVVILKEMVILCDEYGLLPNDMTVEQAEQLLIKNYIDEEQRYDMGVFLQDRYTALDGRAVLPTNSIHRCNLRDVSPVSMINKQSEFSLEKSNLETTLRQTSTMNIPRRTYRGMGPIEVVSPECPGDSYAPSMVIDSGGMIHVAWMDDTDYNGSGGDKDVFYKKKPVGGNWSSVEVVSTESTLNSYPPSLTVDFFGNVHIVWNEYNSYDKQAFVFYKMKPLGGNWSPTEQISLENHHVYSNPYLACDAAGMVHVVWVANCSNVWNLFYRNKPLGGSWSPTEMFTNESNNRFPDYPSLAVETDGTVHVVWVEAMFHSIYWTDEIYYNMRSPDGKWSIPEIISTKRLFVFSMFPSIVIGSDGTVHIAWIDYYIPSLIRGGDILYRMKSHDGTWSRIEKINKKTYLIAEIDLAIGLDETVHIVWSEFSSWYWTAVEGTSIFYSMKPSSGTWVQPAEMISIDSKDFAHFPQIAIGPDMNIVHIAWADHTDYAGQGMNDADIVYRTKPVIENQPPAKPTVVGPRIIRPDVNYLYKFISTDPDGDGIYYYVKSEAVIMTTAWYPIVFGPYNSGEEINISFMWPFRYNILIFHTRAIDANGAIGDLTKFVVIVLNFNDNMNSEPAYNQQNSQSSQQGNQDNQQSQSSSSNQFIQMVIKTTNR
jgi:hypothetical protein